MIAFRGVRHLLLAFWKGLRGDGGFAGPETECWAWAMGCNARDLLLLRWRDR